MVQLDFLRVYTLLARLQGTTAAAAPASGIGSSSNGLTDAAIKFVGFLALVPTGLNLIFSNFMNHVRALHVKCNAGGVIVKMQMRIFMVYRLLLTQFC